MWSPNCFLQIFISTSIWNGCCARAVTCRGEQHITIQEWTDTNITRFVIIVSRYTYIQVCHRKRMIQKILPASWIQGTDIRFNTTVMWPTVRSIASRDYRTMSLLYVGKFNKYILPCTAIEKYFYEHVSLLLEKNWLENSIYCYNQERCIITYACQNMVSHCFQYSSWNDNSRRTHPLRRAHTFARKTLSMIV